MFGFILGQSIIIQERDLELDLFRPMSAALKEMIASIRKSSGIVVLSGKRQIQNIVEGYIIAAKRLLITNYTSIWLFWF